ncbi:MULTISPECIES: hypothetical protein [Amycolatopsis]|uniref:hypothetical protein n=1 Tax=Amycolatopsis TaxID=1813 RepID=UPI001C725525|nr:MULTISPECIES: hypothetical protein [Amycolatopsis]UKD53639.1 hypothetical protein L3Q65_38000 [Amycolatopsis sp. FU40]
MVRCKLRAGILFTGDSITDSQRNERVDLDPKIQAVREHARKYYAHLLAADGMFAEAWLRLVA